MESHGKDISYLGGVGLGGLLRETPKPPERYGLPEGPNGPPSLLTRVDWLETELTGVVQALLNRVTELEHAVFGHSSDTQQPQRARG